MTPRPMKLNTPLRGSTSASRASTASLIGLSALMIAACGGEPSQSNSSESDSSASIVTDTDAKPNFLIVVADDLGWSDIGALGSEINTPNLDKMAQRGMVMTNFYVAPTCSPTRSMLMTGLSNHQAGVGAMEGIAAPNQTTRNYAAQLHGDVVTFAEVLKTHGYETMVSGKWHLAVDESQQPEKRGFDQSFVLLPGGASHFSDQMSFGPVHLTEYVENGERVEELPSDFYSSISYTDKMLSFMDARDANKPFLAYLAYTAPHDPLQVPDEWLDRYDGIYDQGPIATRLARFERQREAGLVPEDTELWDIPNFPPWLPSHITPWDTRSEQEKEHDARPMEIYASMVELMDQQLGRVIDELEASGELDNTYFVFFSDNGASAVAPLMYPGHSEAWMNENWDRDMANAGMRGNFTVQGREWASASNTPFRMFKGSVAEGGIRSPFIVAGPNVPSSTFNDALAHVMDIAPTIYSLAGIDPQSDPAFDGKLPMQGTNLLPVWKQEQELVRDGFQTELFNARAVREGRWKMTNLPRPLGTGEWELYDLNLDPGEANNIASENPDVVARLAGQYETFAEANGVIPPVPPPMQTPRRMYPFVCDEECEASFDRFMALQAERGASKPE